MDDSSEVDVGEAWNVGDGNDAIATMTSYCYYDVTVATVAATAAKYGTNRESRKRDRCRTRN